MLGETLCHAVPPATMKKLQRNWREFAFHKDPVNAKQRIELISVFVAEKRYDPSLDLHEFAGNLYEDVGEVALTLIELRLKQAQQGIQRLLFS